MRYYVSLSNDYALHGVVIRDVESRPLSGRILCLITRDDVEEAKLIAQNICDLLNKQIKDN